MPRRVLLGTVVSDSAHKTVTVHVERRVMHKKYKKYVKKSSKHAAHDEANACKKGDTVSIEECRPISKSKTWKVIEGKNTKGEAIKIDAFDPTAPKIAEKPAAKKAPAKAAPKKPAAKKATTKKTQKTGSDKAE